MTIGGQVILNKISKIMPITINTSRVMVKQYLSDIRRLHNYLIILKKRGKRFVLIQRLRFKCHVMSTTW